jgi:hypothetical protein
MQQELPTLIIQDRIQKHWNPFADHLRARLAINASDDDSRGRTDASS